MRDAGQHQLCASPAGLCRQGVVAAITGVFWLHVTDGTVLLWPQEDAEEACASCVEWLEAHGAVVSHTSGAPTFASMNPRSPGLRCILEVVNLCMIVANTPFVKWRRMLRWRRILSTAAMWGLTSGFPRAPGEPASAAVLDCKASTGKLFVPEDSEAVAHGDQNLAIDDFLSKVAVS